MNWSYLVETFWLSLKGVPTTLQITAVSLIVGSPIALLFAFLKLKEHRIAKQLINSYISIIRGTPMVLQILIIYSLVPSLLNQLVQELDWQLDIFAINPIHYANIVFTMTAVASLTEIYRSAILTVDHGQLDAALASGLTAPMAYFRIIFPQALEIAIPNLCNLTIQLVKGTSLAFIMTVKDITAIAKIQASYAYNYIESYLVVFMIYILICSIIQLLFNGLEQFFRKYQNVSESY